MGGFLYISFLSMKVNFYLTAELFESDLDLMNKNFPNIAKNKKTDLIFGVKDISKVKDKKLENYLLYYDHIKEKYVYRYDKRLMVPKYESAFKYYFKNYFKKHENGKFKYKTLICYEGLFEHLYWNNLEDKKIIFLLSNNHMLLKNKLPDNMIHYLKINILVIMRKIK